MDNQTPVGNEITPQTPAGAATPNGEPTPASNPQPNGTVLTPEEQEEFRQFQEIKATTGLTKFSESAKEAIRLKNELQQAKDALIEKELRLSNPDFDELTEAERENRKIQLSNQKEIMNLKAKEKWREDYATLPADIKELVSRKGGEEAFKSYACDPRRSGADLLTVAHSFTFDIARVEKHNETPKPGLEIGGAGGQQPAKLVKDGYTTAEAQQLRQKNPQLYSRLVREKRLKITD